MSIWSTVRSRRLWIAPATALIVIAVALLVVFQLPGDGGMEFAQRQKVSAKSPLHFSFPEYMDKQSVEGAIDAPDNVKGAWSWEDNVLVFTPETPLKTGEEYVFVVPKATLTSAGTPLGRDLEFVFTVAGPPKVVARIPTVNATRIPAQSKVTLVFDRAMIPLTQVQGEITKETVGNWPVTITPSVEGRWRWISTVAREFIPAKGFTSGTKYTVTVPKGIASVIGDATEEEFTWSFETLRPEVVASTPEPESRLSGPTTELSLTFNREMDLQSAKQYLKLLKGGSGGSVSGEVSAAPVGSSIAIREVKYGTKEVDKKKVTDRTTIVSVPQQPLSFGTPYMLFASAGIRGTEGDLGSLSGYVLNFSTVGDLRVELSAYEQFGNEVQLNFSNPLNPDTLKNGVTFSPALQNAKDLEWSVYDWTENRQARLYPQLKPSTTYTVTVSKSVKDAYGQSLKEPHTFTFTTPPVASQVFIHSRGTFGIFEKGKAPVYYLNAVNVSKLQMQFAKLTLPQFLEIRRTRAGTYSSIPPDLTGFEGYTTLEAAPPSKKKDEWGVLPFDTAKNFNRELAPGIYALTLTAPEAVQPYMNSGQHTEQQYFAITNMAITLKYSGDEALVWVTNMQTGEAVKGAKVAFHSLSGDTRVTGVTDAQGFFATRINIKDYVTPGNDWEPEFWVTAQTADDFAFVSSQWNDGVRPYNFDFNADFRTAQAASYRLDSYVYTERPIYKAGDTVHFKGLVRLRDWSGKYAVPSDRKAHITVMDAQGKNVFDQTLPVSQYGSFHGSMPIDAKANLGTYSVAVQLTPETDIGNNYMYANFGVLAYRKPDYKVDIVTPSEDYFSGQTVSASIEGSYYFGAPMGGAKVAWRAQTMDYYFNKYTDGWYSFALDDVWCWYECTRETKMIAQGEGTLDAAGKLNVAIPVSLNDKPLSQVLSIEADITDENNQVVSNRSSVYVHKADAYVGVRTEDYVVTPGSNAKIGIVTVKPDGSKLPNTRVKVQVFSRTWNSIRKKGVDGGYYYDNEPKDTFIREVSTTTDENGKGTAGVLIGQGGEYRIMATVTDSGGREAKAGTSVYAWSSSYVNWPHTNSDRMEVVADKPEYKVGETAVILLKSPYQGKGVKALVTVEREGIMSRQVIDITSNAQSIQIPITDQFVPNAYVSVVVVKPRVGETFNEHGLDTGAPAFKIGYAKLSVDVSSKRLNVDLTPDKDRYGPGEKVSVQIVTTDATGKGVPSEVSLGVVDMSLLALSSFETPDLTRMFYAERGLGVNTSKMLSQLLERFKPGSKGGGGSDPENKARGNFKDTAFWQPSIVTDAQGKATVSFNLPDNLTTWQLLAIGSTKNHFFGSIAETILETKKVIVRPVRPRFAVRGDKMQLGAIVHNFLQEDQTFTVALAGDGFTSASKVQTVTVKSGEQAKLLFPVTVGEGTKMTMRFTATAGDARDDIQESIPVFIFGTPQTVATTGITETVSEEHVIAPSTKDAQQGTLSIAAAPSLGVYLPSGLEYLRTYPYGCTEQTLSAFVPALALSRLQGFEQLQTVPKKDLDTQITAALQRLYMFQRSDGGFGYWESSRESHPYLTAYVLYGFQLARQAGYKVDDGAYEQAASYLQGQLRATKATEPLDAATRAYIVYVMAEAGRGDIALMNNLFEQRKSLPLFAKAHLALAYQKNSSSSRAKQLVEEMLSSAKVDARGTHFEEVDEQQYGYLMNTNERTTALVLQSLIRIDPKNALIPNVVRYLLAVRIDGHWDTTQSTVHALLAFADFLEATDELGASFKAGIEVNGNKQVEWDVKQGETLQRKEVELALTQLMRGKENIVKIAKTGDGRLYYDVQMSYFFTGDTIQPAEEGIGISRRYKPLAGKSTALTVGNNYLMTLTITVPEDRHFVAVESPLPAGMELVDVKLQTSQQNLLSGLSSDSDMWSWEAWESGLWRFNHQEYRDDQLFLFADHLPAGVYEYRAIVRATTPGTFRERPARAYEMYFPEVFGQTEGGWVTIGE